MESILTPETVSPNHRPNSYSGETSGATTNNEYRQQDHLPSSSSRATGVITTAEARPRTTTTSTLSPPDPEATRSSYMTTSTASRMSGLSDFPVPPRDDDHRSLALSTYFNEPEPLPPPITEQQLVFGSRSHQDAGDLAKTSSSSSS